MYQHTARRPGGCMIITDPSASGPVHTDTLQCCHCDTHYQVQPGSGITRGFCTHCMKPTCGADECCECVPFEKKIQEFEAGQRKTL